MSLNDTYTSTGMKFFAHQEAMKNLRAGKGQCVTTHCMITDICNHTCAFCSVAARAGDSLPFSTITGYLEILLNFGLKSTILSGGGNPILYKCKETGKNFNDVIDWIHGRGLEIGLITNGMPLREYMEATSIRESWATVRPKTLDKITWIRISMAGLDHEENEVYVPDIDPAKTTLGFSYVGHDIYSEPADPHHGKVSTQADLITIGDAREALPPTRTFESRIPELTEQIRQCVIAYQPRYVRLLPNCLEPPMIADRCQKLQAMADEINRAASGFKDLYSPVFVQYKPPAAPKACYLGYIHPVLATDGHIYPCDSCVLNDAAGHKFANPWRICHWSEVAKMYESPVRSLIADPSKMCPGCVFHSANAILKNVVDGIGDITPPSENITHVNFV